MPLIRDAILQKLAPENLCYSPDTLLQNATGQPQINIPSWTDKGLPVGTQFVSKIGDEAISDWACKSNRKLLLGNTRSPTL